MVQDPNKKLVGQLFAQLKSLGFFVEKDDLGYYFTSGYRKFSIMFCGPLFNVFYNEQSQGIWVTKSKKNNFLFLHDALLWIVQTNSK